MSDIQKIQGAFADPCELHIVGIDPPPDGLSDAARAEFLAFCERFRDPRTSLPIPEGLVESITENGVHRPVDVHSERFGAATRVRFVIDGRMRCRASREANVRILSLRGSDRRAAILCPYIVRNGLGEEASAHTHRVIANSWVTLDPPLVIAQNIATMRARGYADGRILEIVSLPGGGRMSPSALRAYESLLKLAPPLREALESGAIGLTGAYQLAHLPPDQQMRAWDSLAATAATDAPPKVAAVREAAAAAAPERPERPARTPRATPAETAARLPAGTVVDVLARLSPPWTGSNVPRALSRGAGKGLEGVAAGIVAGIAWATQREGIEAFDEWPCLRAAILEIVSARAAADPKSPANRPGKEAL